MSSLRRVERSMMTLRQLRAAVVGVAIASMSATPAAAQTKRRLAASRSSARQAPAAAPAGDAANGKVLYGKIGCYQCHSEQGQGGTQGPRLGPRPIAFQAFLRYVRSTERRDAAVQSKGDVRSGMSPTCMRSCRRCRRPRRSAHCRCCSRRDGSSYLFGTTARRFSIV